MESVRVWKKLSVWSVILIIISAIGYGYLFLQQQRSLPLENQILGVIRDKAPVEGPISLSQFKLETLGYDFLITPLASYEAYGVTVSRQGMTPAGVVGLCLVWGDNVVHSIYADLTYSMNQGGCSILNDSAWRKNTQTFAMSGFGSTVLVPFDSAIEAKLAAARIGDQVHLTGYLINYSASDKSGNPAGLASSDTSGTPGSEKVVLVTAFEIMKTWERTGSFLSDVFLAIIISALVILILSAKFGSNKASGKPEPKN